ncbi:MAG TPA: molybdopterin cofactor-binding domain-containing protein [Thermoanaerobaculia bacterium]|nr:molybdopterin cofactor-binding domain-containing protein [Thermoanaerobaculia bacterium]
MSGIFRVTRRDFLRDLGVGTGALVFGLSISPSLSAAEAEPGLLQKLIKGFPVKDVPFVAIKLNGDIVIISHRSEMGQGIRSSLAAVLADDLEADWNRVTLQQADADGNKYAIKFPFDIPADTRLPFPYDKAHEQKPPYLIPAEGAQFTDSSRSMAAYYQPMRIFGTAVRLVMIRSAAEKWGVDEKECRAEKHRVIGPGGRSIDYRWLLLRAGKVKPPTYDEIEDAITKRGPEQWRYIGKGKEKMPFYDALDMVRGKTVFGADVVFPGMLTAMIERCPVANGALVSFDPDPALAVPGVRAVLPMFPVGVRGGGVGRAFTPHAGVAVVATNTWAALQGRRALRPTIKWDLGPHATYDSDTYRTELEASTAKPGKSVRSYKGDDVDAAFTQAGTTVDANYYVPHLAQAPMEPPVAVALFQNGRMEVWAPTQSPDVTQIEVGNVALGLPGCAINDEACNERARQAATVHVTMLGGGFGRKSKPDYIVEAAMLARVNPGVPIRVQWTREDDIKFSYYNAVSNQYLKAALGGDGRPTAFLQRSAFTSFFGTIFPNSSTPDMPADVIAAAKTLRAEFVDSGVYPYGSGIERAQGLEDMPFDVPRIRIENCPAENHIRVGWMRSVANVYHAFGLGSFADEMAIAAGRDSKNYLLELIGRDRILPLRDEEVAQYRNNELPVSIIEVPVEGGKMKQMVPGYPPETSRLRAVVEAVAKESGWDEKVKQYKNMKGRGLGIAAHRSFLSYVAIVVDVSLSAKNELTINEVFGTIHCGLAVNRDRVLAQMEGGIVYGLSYALLGEITVKEGAVVQNNFDDYPILRINQSPKISIHIIDSLEPPTGVGEPPTPAVAPALANAIVAAGGPRIREMPFRKKVVVL